jgi:hypothetical protein
LPAGSTEMVYPFFSFFFWGFGYFIYFFLLPLLPTSLSQWERTQGEEGEERVFVESHQNDAVSVFVFLILFFNLTMAFW